MSQGINIADRGAVRWIEIDRPESKNGLTPDVNGAIIDAVQGATAAADIRVLVLTGAGGSFCSGLDLKDAMRRGMQAPEAVRDNGRTYFHGLIRALHAVELPTIAAVDGPAVGFGCDLALACDIRLLSERARFGEIFVHRGLMPDGGSTFMLPRLIGLGRALELMYTGDIVDAATAVRIGLANHLYPTDEFTARVTELAERLAKGPPMAYRLIKQAVHASLDGSLDQALERELDGQLQCLQSRDFAEGMASFFAKREPNFTGK